MIKVGHLDLIKAKLASLGLGMYTPCAATRDVPCLCSPKWYEIGHIDLIT